MSLGRTGHAVSLAAALIALLGACSSSKPPAGADATPSSIPGCDLAPDTAPGRILELGIAQEFYDEHLFADPAPKYHIIDQGTVLNTIDFNQWWDLYEGDSHLLLGGMTMAQWETELMAKVFPDRHTVYAGYCGGWRFSAYLRQHPPNPSQNSSIGAPPSATATQG